MSLGNRPRVDHTYQNFSNYFKDGGKVVKQKAAGRNFPSKLHLILSEPAYSHIIAWMPHGRAFKIIDRELLTTEVIPVYLKQTKYESFARQLNGWGYKRLYAPGPDHGCYYHEMMLRGMPKLTSLMTRDNSQGKLLPNPEDEPDLYMFSRLHPLPELDTKASSSMVQELEAQVTLPHFQTLPINVAQSASVVTAQAGRPHQRFASFPASDEISNLAKAMAQDTASGNPEVTAGYAQSSLPTIVDQSKPKADANVASQQLARHETTTTTNTTTTSPAGSSSPLSSDEAAPEILPSDTAISFSGISSVAFGHGALSRSWPGPNMASAAAGSQLSQSHEAGQATHQRLASSSSSGELGGNRSSDSDSSSFKRDMLNLIDNFPL